MNTPQRIDTSSFTPPQSPTLTKLFNREEKDLQKVHKMILSLSSDNLQSIDIDELAALEIEYKNEIKQAINDAIAQWEEPEDIKRQIRHIEDIYWMEDRLPWRRLNDYIQWNCSKERWEESLWYADYLRLNNAIWEDEIKEITNHTSWTIYAPSMRGNFGAIRENTIEALVDQYSIVIKKVIKDNVTKEQSPEEYTQRAKRIVEIATEAYLSLQKLWQTINTSNQLIDTTKNQRMAYLEKGKEHVLSLHQEASKLLDTQLRDQYLEAQETEKNQKELYSTLWEEKIYQPDNLTTIITDAKKLPEKQQKIEEQQKK